MLPLLSTSARVYFPSQRDHPLGWLRSVYNWHKLLRSSCASSRQAIASLDYRWVGAVQLTDMIAENMNVYRYNGILMMTHFFSYSIKIFKRVINILSDCYWLYPQLTGIVTQSTVLVAHFAVMRSQQHQWRTFIVLLCFSHFSLLLFPAEFWHAFPLVVLSSAWSVWD